MIKTFKKWCESKKLDIDALLKDEPAPRSTVQEKTARAGIAHWAYPDSYIRSHYPDQWFMPRAADAAQKMGNHKPDHKAA